MQTKLQTLIQQGLVWHGQVTDNQAATLSSGFSSLDTALGGGWQYPGLHEWQLPTPFSEQALLLPLIQHAVQQKLSVFWVNPPAWLSAAGLHHYGLNESMQVVVQTSAEKAAWAFEQILQTKNALALGWFAQKETTAQSVRRWYKAAQTGQMGVVLSEPALNEEARAYSNRVRLKLGESGVTLDILKRKVGWPLEGVVLN
ncbi:SulA-like SOS-response cell division inhibitor [Idiomarina loihiensis]|uniref:ImuA family protein n=1 Tax=Idiomarina loihiensis TaxID=135577 RepID=UPI00129C4303|nr:SulA-like SOS-response cell division inhibitor [Idiomarina loihiensis]MRJ44246.1 SulA-like SOS-response cell division inhibitor [Idiomarina loihiensis]UTW32711.1 SulA-like SOS-response cell division inhibitor [Idiomarina loihiensis]